MIALAVILVALYLSVGFWIAKWSFPNSDDIDTAFTTACWPLILFVAWAGNK